MEDFRHLPNVSTLKLNPEACVGCGECLRVCPHGVLSLNGRWISLADKDGCMECGACALNCPAGALEVTPGVGCAAYIVQTWLLRLSPALGKKASCCS
ncbi:MAG: mercury methylation ferredoxin HgcB [Thermodesulfobacteriota bacterium]